MVSPPVFAHYMVGGLNADQALSDVLEGKAMGLDAFALNIITLDWWCQDAVKLLFEAAVKVGFGLFFVFDMTHFTLPSQFFPLLLMWITSAQYYHYNGLPFVSTYDGGLQTFGESSPNAGWQIHYHDELANQGVTTYFVPAFSDSNVNPSTFFDTFTAVDGAMNWNSWPWKIDGKTPMKTIDDVAYMASAAEHDKSYMMAISTHQFKHLDGWQNWYRTGAGLLPLRMSQALNLTPTFLEIITWNDAGESTYIGNLWPEAIPDATTHAYTDKYPHTAWQILYKAFIVAYKAGNDTLDAILPTEGLNAQGVFWYRPFLASGSCDNDPLGKPGGWENAVDEIVGAVMLKGPAVGSTIKVYSGGNMIGSLPGLLGLNTFSFPAQVGKVHVEVIGIDGITKIAGDGSLDVTGWSDMCNFNYIVEAMA